jgi:hypothetical protein
MESDFLSQSHFSIEEGEGMGSHGRTSTKVVSATEQSDDRIPGIGERLAKKIVEIGMS